MAPASNDTDAPESAPQATGPTPPIRLGNAWTEAMFKHSRIVTNDSLPLDLPVHRIASAIARHMFKEAVADMMIKVLPALGYTPKRVWVNTSQRLGEWVFIGPYAVVRRAARFAHEGFVLWADRPQWEIFRWTKTPEPFYSRILKKIIQLEAEIAEAESAETPQDAGATAELEAHVDDDFELVERSELA